MKKIFLILIIGIVSVAGNNSLFGKTINSGSSHTISVRLCSP